MDPRPAMAIAIAASALMASAAPPRMAMVRVKEIYAGLPATRELQDDVKKERGAILNDERAEQLRTAIRELQELADRMNKTKSPIGDETNREAVQEYEIKRQEAQTLQREFETYRTQREQEINRKMVSSMRQVLDHIMKVSQTLAADRGYDLVIDSSGETNTGVPFVLYSRSAPDLTDEVAAALTTINPPTPAQSPVSEPLPAGMTPAPAAP